VIQKNLCIKTDIIEIIHNLKNVNEDTKNYLKYYAQQKMYSQRADERLCGMALVLHSEGLITNEEYVTLIMYGEGERKEESVWKSFLKIIRFWER
jgi:hypothetical protein